MATGSVIELSASDFDAAITDPVCPILVKFFAPWCAPCRALAADFADLAEQYADRVLFAEVNVDEEPELAERFKIRSVPTVLMFRGGSTTPIRGLESASGEDVENWLAIIAPD